MFDGEKAMIGGMDMPSMPKMQPVEERLEMRLAVKKQEIVDLENALAILKAQPELLEALNVLRKVGI